MLNVMLVIHRGSKLGLVVKVGDTKICDKGVAAGGNSVSFTDGELDRFYRLFGGGSVLTVTFVVSTAGLYSSSKSCMVSLKR